MQNMRNDAAEHSAALPVPWIWACDYWRRVVKNFSPKFPPRPWNEWETECALYFGGKWKQNSSNCELSISWNSRATLKFLKANSWGRALPSTANEKIRISKCVEKENGSCCTHSRRAKLFLRVDRLGGSRRVGKQAKCDRSGRAATCGKHEVKWNIENDDGVIIAVEFKIELKL